MSSSRGQECLYQRSCPFYGGFNESSTILLMCIIIINTSHLLIVIGMVTGIQTTSEDLIWSIPSNAPNNCFSHYTVSLEGSSRRLANFTTNIASFMDLNSAGFPCCVRQTITITPVTMTGTPVTTSSGSREVYFRDPGKVDA